MLKTQGVMGRGVDAYADDLGVVIRQKCWDKMFGWCRAANTEVSGLGLVKKEGDTFKVSEVFLLEQECTGAGTTLDTDSIARLQHRLHRRKIPLGGLRFWWHTHHDFSTFWSNTDQDTARRLVGNSAEWIISLVINQKGDDLCRFDMFNPIQLTIDEVDVQVAYPRRKGYIRKCKNDIRRKVREKTYQNNCGYVVPKQIGYTYPRYDQGWEYIQGYGYVPVGSNLAKDWEKLQGRNGGSVPSEQHATQGEIWPTSASDGDQPPDGEWSYKGEKGAVMVWVPYLRCYVPKGSEGNASFDYDDKRYTRSELRQLMLRVEQQEEQGLDQEGVEEVRAGRG